MSIVDERGDGRGNGSDMGEMTGEVKGEMKNARLLCLKGFPLSDGRDEHFFHNNARLFINNPSLLRNTWPLLALNFLI
jgi:hypothetical protein